MNTTKSPGTELSDAFVQEAYRAMHEKHALNGQMQMETARQVFYRHGIVASSDDLRALILRVRRLHASNYPDTGI